MFRKSNPQQQLDAFASVSTMLSDRSVRQYNNPTAWHNLFRQQVVMRLDESVFKELYHHTNGAPNAPIRLLVGMMIMKDAFVWSDSQLYEHCKFNVLVRSALGLFNLNDPLPVESTYYLFQKRLYEYEKQHGTDLMARAFTDITRKQINDFQVNGHHIRMDSKLMGSNIALFTRYEIVHQTLCKFYESLEEHQRAKLSAKDRKKLEGIVEEEANKTVYRSTKEDINSRLRELGELINRVLKPFKNLDTDACQLLQRVFREQYHLADANQVELRPKDEIVTESVQSPHDQDCAYRHKRDQMVKGYSVNVAETASDEGLNLITNVKVDKANVSDHTFVQPALEASRHVTGQKAEKVFVDGGYQSPANDDYCQDIDMVFTGIQGEHSRYDLQMSPTGLVVTDTQTGEIYRATLAKKLKNSCEDRWRINTPQGYRYFGQRAIRTANLRRQMKERPPEELQKRNNVEATIFQFSIPLRGNKSKYRGRFRNQLFAYCRCLWINMIRIINHLGKIISSDDLSSFGGAVLLTIINQLKNILWVLKHNRGKFLPGASFGVEKIHSGLNMDIFYPLFGGDSLFISI